MIGLEAKLYPAKNVPVHMERLYPMWKAHMAEIGENGTVDELLEEIICRLNISESNENVFFDIMEFYITPQWRRRNIGVRCIRKIEEKLKDKGCPKIYLTSVEESQEFWRKVGFIKSELVDPDNHLNIWIK